MTSKPDRDLSKREVAYLRRVSRSGRVGIRLSALARELSVAPPSALEEVRHLEAKGLLRNTGGRITLTKEGRRMTEAIRKTHLSFETVLTRLGVPIQEACRSIHDFDFAVPQELADRVYEAIGRPDKCPKGELEC
jgi:DtxR family Mn-dependent transcriptional regulator